MPAIVKNKRGFLLISSLFVLSTMIIIVSFYLNGILQSVRVASIVDTSPQTYYLAESGIQHAIWKLQNDATWKTGFETDPEWSATITQNNTMVSGGGWTVTVENQELARALITATSTIAVRDTQTQRVVEASVYKALNITPLNTTSLFANNDIIGTGSEVAVSDGGIFANNDIKLSLFSTWSTTGKAQAVDDIEVSISSSLSAAEGVFDSVNPPLPEIILMPAIDFDSADPNSYKSRASQVYTNQQFNKLLDDFPVVELNGITYVTGNVFITKGKTLTINGTLVADGSVSIGNGFSFETEPAVLTVIDQGVDEPSGVLSKKNITIGGFNSDVNIQGLLYAGGTFTIKDGITQNVSTVLEGAVFAEDINIVISWQPTTVQLNQIYINEALGDPLFTQLLFINHWEEEY